MRQQRENDTTLLLERSEYKTSLSDVITGPTKSMKMKNEKIRNANPPSRRRVHGKTKKCGFRRFFSSILEAREVGRDINPQILRNYLAGSLSI